MLDSLSAAPWLNALTLPERSRHIYPHPVSDAPLAERRLQRWQRLFSQQPTLLAQRWQQAALDDQRLRQIFGALPAVPATAAPGWVARLEQALAADEHCLNFGPQAAGSTEQFLFVVEPLIAQGLAQLRTALDELAQQHPQLPFDLRSLPALLFANLPSRLLNQLIRTLVLELNVARVTDQLAGATAAERFQAFVARLRQTDQQRALWDEYPVLARSIVVSIEQWVTTSVELVRHLCADWPEIAAVCAAGRDLGQISAIRALGDRHRGGRSVAIIEWASGFKLVYKPRSLAVEAQFQRLLGWLNARGLSTPFKPLTLITRPHHGWVEFVDAQPCADSAAVTRFYRRQGGYLALLYALAATDFHAENLIAHGEHPVLIDLESLFQPAIGDATHIGQQAVSESVLRIGLLPQRWWMDASADGVDVSGLSDLDGQLTPDALPDWQDEATDSMRMVRKRQVMKQAQNRPQLPDATVRLYDYRAALSAGFAEVYALLLAHRAELLAADGPLSGFASAEVRIILRATRTYSALLNESFHPDVLRDALDRDLLFDRLWLQAEQQPWLATVIAAEQRDLQRGDIPIFVTRPAQRHIWSSDGTQIDDFCPQSGLDLAHQRLARLSAADMQRQLWIIGAALETTVMAEESLDAPNPQRRGNAAVPAASAPALLDAALHIGQRLNELAFRSADGAAWLGLAPLQERHWNIMPLSYDLYSGSGGVALFLAYLGALSGEQRYTRLAEQALHSIQHELAQTPPRLIGGYNGWGSAIYLLTHLGVLWGRDDLLQTALDYTRHLRPLIAHDRCFDVLGGAAGALAVLLGLYAHLPEPELLASAIDCAEHLLRHAQPMAVGCGWPALSAAATPLTGFSHGCAGIAWALLKLYAVTADVRWHTLAAQALAYERSTFVPAVDNWPDLRTADAEVCKLAWCHGAPGIGMARLNTLNILDDADVRAEIAAALRSTQSGGFGGNHSLCHGDLGNLELLLQAAAAAPPLLADGALATTLAQLLERYAEYGWLCGVPGGAETPGLLTGLAGIGYMLLRAAHPDKVPALLLLEPPR